MKKHERFEKLWNILKNYHSDAKCALEHSNAFELLIATILSAQCTDKRVNIVTRELFKKYNSPKKFADADLAELEHAIKSTNFFRNKAKSIKVTSQMIVEQFGGKVPQTMEELLSLRGVARKTANVVLGNAFNITSGIVVDTHVARLSNRIGLTKHLNPVKIEQDLCKIVPKEDWVLFSHVLIDHGRQICIARKPRCDKCPINELCPKRVF